MTDLTAVVKWDTSDSLSAVQLLYYKYHPSIVQYCVSTNYLSHFNRPWQGNYSCAILAWFDLPPNACFEVCLVRFSLLSLEYLIYKQNFRKSCDFSPEYQAKCISCFSSTTRSVAEGQRNFLNSFKREPSLQPNIKYCHKKFVETGSVLIKKCTTQQVRKTFLNVFSKYSSIAQVNLLEQYLHNKTWST